MTQLQDIADFCNNPILVAGQNFGRLHHMKGLSTMHPMMCFVVHRLPVSMAVSSFSHFSTYRPLDDCIFKALDTPFQVTNVLATCTKWR